MSFRTFPVGMFDEPEWRRLSADARALFFPLKAALGLAGIGQVWAEQLDSLGHNAEAALAELVEGGVAIVNRVASGARIVWLKRWTLDAEPTGGPMVATAALNAVEDLPAIALLPAWYAHHRELLRKPTKKWRGKLPANLTVEKDRLQDPVEDPLQDPNSRAKEKETERETSQKVSLAQSESPDSAREAAGPDGPPRGAPAAGWAAVLHENGVDVPLAARVPAPDPDAVADSRRNKALFAEALELAEAEGIPVKRAVAKLRDAGD